MITEANVRNFDPLSGQSERVLPHTWSLTQTSFDSLLRHLHPNREVAGAAYEETRRKLVRFFAARGVELADCLADEALDRAIKRFEAGAVIPNFQSYCFGVARLLCLELRRQRKREQMALVELARTSRTISEEDDSQAENLNCLERLLNELPEHERRLIIAYYQSGDGAIETRKRLAQELGIAPNAVRIRVHRIRRKLEARFQDEQPIDYSIPTKAATNSTSRCYQDSAAAQLVRPLPETRLHV